MAVLKTLPITAVCFLEQWGWKWEALVKGEEMGWPGLVCPATQVTSSCLCACCYSPPPCVPAHLVFLAPSITITTPTAEFSCGISCAQFQCREENVNSLFTSSAYFCNAFWQVYLCCNGLSFSTCCWYFLKHILPKTFTVADKKLKQFKFFGGGWWEEGTTGNWSLHCGRWALVAMGQFNPGPLHWKVDFQPLDQKVPEMSEIALMPPYLDPLLFYSFSFFFREEYI